MPSTPETLEDILKSLNFEYPNSVSPLDNERIKRLGMTEKEIFRQKLVGFLCYNNPDANPGFIDMILGEAEAKAEAKEKDAENRPIEDAGGVLPGVVEINQACSGTDKRRDASLGHPLLNSIISFIESGNPDGMEETLDGLDQSKMQEVAEFAQRNTDWLVRILKLFEGECTYKIQMFISLVERLEIKHTTTLTACVKEKDAEKIIFAIKKASELVLMANAFSTIEFELSRPNYICQIKLLFKNYRDLLCLAELSSLELKKRLVRCICEDEAAFQGFMESIQNFKGLVDLGNFIEGCPSSVRVEYLGVENAADSIGRVLVALIRNNRNIWSILLRTDQLRSFLNHYSFADQEAIIDCLQPRSDYINFHLKILEECRELYPKELAIFKENPELIIFGDFDKNVLSTRFKLFKEEDQLSLIENIIQSGNQKKGYLRV